MALPKTVDEAYGAVNPEQPLTGGSTGRALGQLNERRGRYQQLARPVVFWVPEYVLRLIATHAPDF